MQKRMKVCLIEEDKHIRYQIENYMQGWESFELAGIAVDGRDGARLLKSMEFDAAIISAILPYRDGLTVMREHKIETDSKNIVFAILIPVYQESLVRSVVESGADCSFPKPNDKADVEIMFKKIADLHKSKAHPQIPDLEWFSESLLRKLGIQNNLKGYTYLKSAISKTVSNRSVTEGMTKILYPGIAKEFATTSSRVERDMRHAISESWKNSKNSKNSENNLNESNKFVELLYCESFREVRPTNRDFIVAAAKAFERLTVTYRD